MNTLYVRTQDALNEANREAQQAHDQHRPPPDAVREVAPEEGAEHATEVVRTVDVAGVVAQRVLLQLRVPGSADIVC